MWSYIDDRNDHSFDKGSVLFLFHKNCFYKNKRLKIVKTLKISRSSRPDVFLRKVVLKIWSKFTGEHSCRNVISIKLQSNFIEITLRHECSPVNLLHIFRTPFPSNFNEITLRHRCSLVNLLHIFGAPFPRNTSWWLLLIIEWI